jgi:hypothetical protein
VIHSRSWWEKYKQERETKWNWFGQAKKNQIKKIDQETILDGKEFGIKQEESIKFKQHSDCKLFRCLVCWLMIHPDDEITEHKEGYAHKICLEGKQAFPRRKTQKELLYESRAECVKCHHSKRVHSEFGYGCFGYSGRNEYGCECQGFRPYKDGRIV